MRASVAAVGLLVLVASCKTNSSSPSDAPGSDASTTSHVIPSAATSPTKPPDSTDAARQQCDAEVLKLVQELKGPMTITAYMTGGQPKLDQFIGNVRGLLKRLEAGSAGKLKVELINPTTDNQKEAAKQAGIQEAAFGEAETDDAVAITRGFLGLVFSYGGEETVIPILSPDQSQGLEFWVANKIRETRAQADDVKVPVGVIARDGIKLTDPDLVPMQGTNPGPNIKGILTQALPFYRIEEVDLEGGDAAIDSELRGVIVLQPEQDFTDKELARLDEFVMRGDKSLFVMAGAANMQVADAKMAVSMSTHRIDKLLSGYGIEMKQGVVANATENLSIRTMDQNGQPQLVTAPGLLTLSHDESAKPDDQPLDSSFAAFFRLETLSFPYPSPLVPHPDKQPEARFSVVARTAKSSVVLADSDIELRPATGWTGTGEQSSQAIAIAVEGKLTSAFGDAAPEGVSINSTTPRDSRILVISSGQFLSNPFARAGNPPPMPPQMAMLGGAELADRELTMLATPYAQQYLTATILAFKNTLDWMTTDAGLISCSALLIADVPPEKVPEVTTGKCTKEQMHKLMDSGLSLDDALELCNRQ